MCEYCEIYDRHKEKLTTVIDASGIKHSLLLILFTYWIGLIVGGLAKSPESVMGALQEAFGAGYSRGFNARTNKEDACIVSSSEQKH